MRPRIGTWILTTLAVSIAAKPAGAAKYARDRGDVLRLADPSASTATWRTLVAELPLEYDEGLIVAGAACAHERVTARRFGHFLHRKFGLRLVLLSKIDRMTVPAFDGLIVDDEDRVVANVSMKRTINRFNFRDSHAKIDGYNRIDTWVDNLLLHHAGRARGVWFASAEALGAFDRRTLLIRDVARVFGVGTRRQTWMLMEFASRGDLPEERIAAFARRAASWNAHVSRILVIDDRRVFDVKPKRTRPVALEGCERVLDAVP